jgi:hypothetical protein
MAEPIKPPAAPVEGPEGSAPVKSISPDTLVRLGQEFSKLFDRYSGDRRLAEQKWMRNLRQYLGLYDPEIERELPVNRSRAYPRITRVKCISMLSRVMNLMFPGNERNWELRASPSPDMDPADVANAVQALMARRQQDGLDTQLNEELIDHAIQELANERASALSRLIDDQLQELGGDQTADFITLNRSVCMSGIKYGAGVLQGPYVREIKKTAWRQVENGQFQPQEVTLYKPQYTFLPIWDFYPDMTGRCLPGDGYFVRMVVTGSELRKLGRRPGFLQDQVKKVMARDRQGNYKPKEFETELRSMGTKAHVNDTPSDPQGKYEVITWYGPISGKKLAECGANVPEGKMTDDLEAELWMVGGTVIKVDINPWRKLGVDVKTIHTFVFDEDETSPVGNGLPNVLRDSQMSVCAATRATLDNASIVVGPNFEVNTQLLRADQDLTSIESYKIWYRDDDGPSANFPAVRQIPIDGHFDKLQLLVQMFMGFADVETFIGAATGGDLEKLPSEPMRTAAGASMLRGDAALPFKDIIRNYDGFTQSVIQSLVQFNRKFNPALAPAGDYNVIARGATSLIAKEVRGIQIDGLSQTLTEEERDHIDERQFVKAKFAVRDMEDMLVPESVAKQRKEARQQHMAQQAELQKKLMEAEVRKVLADAFKGITQGQKNAAAADAHTATTAIDIMMKPLEIEAQEKKATNGSQQ